MNFQYFSFFPPILFMIQQKEVDMLVHSDMTATKIGEVKV